MSKGTRYIDGREYILCGRESSKGAAKAAAQTLRERWGLVRTIKLSDFDFMLYVHGRMQGK